MRNLTIHSQDTAPAGSREALSGAEQKFGFVPNVLNQMAESPAMLNGALILMGLLDECSLSPAERWITLIATALRNCSGYCVAANSTTAGMMGVPNELIQALRIGQPLADKKLEALRSYVTEMVENRGAASPQTAKRFFDAGYTNAQHLDVILGIGLETIASLTASSSATPVDEAFQSYVWSQSNAA